MGDFYREKKEHKPKRDYGLMFMIIFIVFIVVITMVFIFLVIPTWMNNWWAWLNGWTSLHAPASLV